MTGVAQMPPPPRPSVAGLGAASSSIPEGSVGDSAQPSGSRRFYRRRVRGACEACRGRRIRCDAMNLGVPCTNCTAFAVECTVLHGKARKKSAKDGEGPELPENKSKKEKESNIHPMQLLERQLIDDDLDLNLYAKFMDPKHRHAPIEAGKVGYIAEHTNLALLFGEDTVHYPMPGNIVDSRTKLIKLGTEEVALLRQRGALLLPHWSHCDDLVEAYFQYVAPTMPIINRSRFMRQYRDPDNPPSLLLLQCIFLAGSKVTSKTYPKDAEEAAMPCSRTFYKRAKALYDSEYEDDRIVVLQALILLGWHGEENGDATKNVFYWTGLATTVAQGSGVHRSAENSRLPKTDKRLWKRIWWTLFTRDRSDAIAHGRPTHINTDDSDVEMICAEDFLDDEESYVAEYRPDPIHVHFFIQYVSLCKIMSLLLSSEHLAPLQDDGQNPESLKQCDLALVEWLQNCPEDVKWEQSQHNFWAAILHCAYHVTVGLRHRELLPIILPEEDLYGKGYSESHTSPLPLVVCQAASEITIAAESMIHAGQIEYSPAIMIYALALALNTNVYQVDFENLSVDTTSPKKILTCMYGLEKLSAAWIAAKVIYDRFETILQNTRYCRNLLGEDEFAKDGQSPENPVNGSNMNLFHLIAASPGETEPVRSQYRDSLGQGTVDLITSAMFPQGHSTPLTLQPLPFSSMNLMGPAEQAGYNATDSAQKMPYLPSQPVDMSHYTFHDLQASLPESHEELSRYDFSDLFPQDLADAENLATNFW